MSQISHQQQQFINEYLTTGNGKLSAIAAGYSANTAQEQASRLLKQPSIKQAIEQAQSQARDGVQIKVMDLVNELEQARKEALSQGQCSAAISATMGKAKLLGLDKQIIEHSGQVGIKQVQDLSDAELNAELLKYGIQPAQVCVN